MATNHSVPTGSVSDAHGPPLAPSRPRSSPGRGLALATLLALGLHFLLLGRWPQSADRAAPVVLPSIQARWLLPPLSPADTATEVSSSAAIADDARSPGVIRTSLAATGVTPGLGGSRSGPVGAHERPRADHRPDTVPTRVDRSPEPEPAQSADRRVLPVTAQAGLPTEPPAPPGARGLDMARASAAESTGPDGRGGEPADSVGEPPVYPTRIPPSICMGFRLERGLLRGEAVLHWQHGTVGAGAASYQLSLETRAAGLTLLSQSSQGGFDSAGLAPARFTDRRLRGSTRATSFQRERGVVSFSGPGVEYPLRAGAQDRLSWMLQLTAIVAALPPTPALLPEIQLQVFGARGDSAVWSFKSVGADPVSVGAVSIDAVKWVRMPHQPNDTQVEIWLDPALHHLPLRLRMSNPPDGEVFDLLRTTP